MTEAEILAQKLQYGVAPQMEEAAALIREQEAKIKRMAEALRVCDLALSKVSDGSTSNEFRRVYADALRDAGVES